MSYFRFLVAATAVWESSQAVQRSCTACERESSQAVQRSCTACELSQTAVAATRNQKYDKNIPSYRGSTV